MLKEYKVAHFFCGIGGAALGFQRAVEEYRGMVGRFRTLAGIDVDPEACADFETITGAQAVQMDLFSREDYIAFHSHEPPPCWREVTPADICAAMQGERPDVGFISAPCQGNSGLISEEAAQSPKYQALNNLSYRGIWLAIDAWKDDPVPVYMFENVPRITKRSADLLGRIRRLLIANGYEVHPKNDKDGFHDCGKVAGLGQHRKRYLMIARHKDKVSSYIYKPHKKKLKTIGDVIGSLPLPDDPACGPMHRLQRLSWLIWLRLSLIPPGGDWRDLNRIASEQYRLEYIPRGGGPYGVMDWHGPASTVIGQANIRGSNAAAVADVRLRDRASRHPSVYRVVDWDESSPCITGTRFGSGATAVGDIRVNLGDNTHKNLYRLIDWGQPAHTVTGATRPAGGAASVADIRLGCSPRSGSYGVQDWNAPGKTITGSADIHQGTAAIGDIRIPDLHEKLDPPPIIISPWETWNRPLTTYENAMLQGFPTHLPDGRPFQLSGKSDARWRKRIGNAVPPPSAEVWAGLILRTLLLSSVDSWELSPTPIWVIPNVTVPETEEKILNYI
jgi:site-specific DNA-cytosine methylase